MSRKLVADSYKVEADGGITGTDGDGVTEVIFCQVFMILHARHHETGRNLVGVQQVGVDGYISAGISEVEQSLLVDVGTVVGIIVSHHAHAFFKYLYHSCLEIEFMNGIAFADP